MKFKVKEFNKKECANFYENYINCIDSFVCDFTCTSLFGV